MLNMPWTQVSASFSLILCRAVILNYSKGMVLQLPILIGHPLKILSHPHRDTDFSTDFSTHNFN